MDFTGCFDGGVHSALEIFRQHFVGQARAGISVPHWFFLLLKEDVKHALQHAKRFSISQKFFCVLRPVFYVFFYKRAFGQEGCLNRFFPNNQNNEEGVPMKRVNRREFLTLAGAATAISMVVPVLASTSATDQAVPGITSLHVRGLVMVDLENPELIRLGFPKAPGHKATLSFLPANGARQVLPLKGQGTLEAKPIASPLGKVVVPELIRMKEFYGEDVKSHVDLCPGSITIPRNVIRSVQATELTAARYTFVRTDTGEEVSSFRPRQLADAIKIDVSSAGILKLDSGKMTIPLDTTRELRVEYAPERPIVDPFADHFHHYFPYIERPAALDFDVVPRKVGASSSPTPKGAHHFMMLDSSTICGLVALP
jgi:hypothetical protein